MEVEAGELRELQAGGEGLALGVEQGLDGIEVTFLQLDVGRDGHGAEAVMAVGEFGGLAEFRRGVGCPAADLGELGGESQGGGEDFAVEFTLREQDGGLGLAAPGFGDVHRAAGASADRQRQADAEAEGGFAVAGGCLREEWADADGGLPRVTRETDRIALLFQLQEA